MMTDPQPTPASLPEEITDEMLHLVEAAYQRGLRDGKNSGEPA